MKYFRSIKFKNHWVLSHTESFKF